MNNIYKISTHAIHEQHLPNISRYDNTGCPKKMIDLIFFYKKSPSRNWPKQKMRLDFCLKY